MENLKYPKEKYLMNTISAKDLVETADGNIALGSIGQFIDITNDDIVVSYTNPGHGSGIFLSLNARATVSDGDTFDYGFAIRREVKLPGIDNEYPRHHAYGRPYFETIKALSVNSGSISDADQEVILSSLMDALYADRNNNQSNFFESKKAYYVTADAVTITLDIDGTTFSSGTVGTAALAASALLAAINHSSTGSANAFAVLANNTTLIVMSKENGVDILVEAGTNTTIVDKGIVIMSTLDGECKAVVEVNDDFMTPSIFTLVSIDYNATSSAYYPDYQFDMHYVTSAGIVTTGSIANTTVGNIDTAAEVAVLINAHTAACSFGSSANDILYIVNKYGNTNGNSLRGLMFRPLAEIDFGYNVINKGVISNNTSKDLYNLFIGQYIGMHGVRQNVPIENEKYCILHITKGGTSPALSSGASSYETFKTRFDVVILQSLLGDSLRYSSDYLDDGTSKYLYVVINHAYDSTGTTSLIVV